MTVRTFFFVGFEQNVGIGVFGVGPRDLCTLNEIADLFYGELTAFSCILNLSPYDESGDKSEKPVTDRL